jgi:hypothetical protein
VVWQSLARFPIAESGLVSCETATDCLAPAGAGSNQKLRNVDAFPFAQLLSLCVGQRLAKKGANAPKNDVNKNVPGDIHTEADHNG